MKNALILSVFGLLLLLIITGCTTGFSQTDAAALYYNLGNAYFDLERWADAADAYKKAMGLDKGLFQASYNLARVYIESGDIAAGVEELNALLKEEPENTILLDTLGYALSLEGKFEAALAAYEGTLARNKFDINAMFNKGILLWKLERYEDALAVMEACFDLAPSDKDVLKNLAGINIDLERYVDVIRYLEAYIEQEPNDADMLIALADAYRVEQYYAKALETYDAALAVDKAKPRAIFEKARILLVVIGDGVNGLKTLEEAVVAGFTDKESLLDLAKDPDLLNPEEIKAFLVNKELLSEEDLTHEEDLTLEEDFTAEPPAPAAEPVQDGPVQNGTLQPAYPENP